MSRILGSGAGLLAFLGVAGCMPSLEDPDPSCETLTDCDFGFVCSQGTCIPEELNSARGEFRCRVGAENDVGYSSITASVEGSRMQVTGVANCSIHEDMFLLSYISPVTQGGMTYRLNLVLRWDDVQWQGGSHQILPPDTSIDYDSAHVIEFLNYEFARVVAYGVAGEVVLHEAAVAGQLLTGFVDIDLLPTPFDTQVGIPCPNGMVDCSATLTDMSTVHCRRSYNDSFLPICMSDCTNDTDCYLYGGRCLDGKCHRTCTHDTDCEAPFRCIIDTSHDFNYCWGGL